MQHTNLDFLATIAIASSNVASDYISVCMCVFSHALYVSRS